MKTKTKKRSYPRSRLPDISQLKIADAWGRKIGDSLCGPLTFYAFLSLHSGARLETGLSEFKRYKKFYQNFFHPLRSEDGLTLEGALACLESKFKKILLPYRVHDLMRPRGVKHFAKLAQNQLSHFTRGGRPVILQIAAYDAKVIGNKNKWTRGLGHFLLLLRVEPVASSIDPFFNVEYWDPWDGRLHHAVIFEEIYRDFMVPTLSKPGQSLNQQLRRSPSGHRVLSPNLCLLAPHLDLYSHKVYFAQRYLYILERALL